MLLEKSIVFVSADPAKLSSVILGLIALMKPFNWCYTFATNLPAAMLGILDSPIPMIVGISHDLYGSLREDENYDEEMIESKTWVFLDQVYDHSFEMICQGTGIEWSTNEQDAISMEEYLWYREYTGLAELINIH